MTETEQVVQRLGSHVGSMASRLQRGYQNDRPDAVAALAILRRGVSLSPGVDPRVAALTTGDLFSDDDHLPIEPHRAEYAAHAALTLFAVHQQSHRERGMHHRDYPFGRSIRLLGKGESDGRKEAIRRRFNAVATAEEPSEVLHHARGLVQQLRTAGVQLDYAGFARDLYWLQTPGGGDRVRRAWGRDFFRVTRSENDTDTDPSDSADALDPEKKNS